MVLHTGWSNSAFNPKNWGGGGSSTTVDQPKGGRGSEDLYSKPKNSAADDLMMDLGLKEKNDVYYRDLADRQARSQALMEQAQNSNDDDRAADLKAKVAEPETVTAPPKPEPTDPTPPPPPAPTPPIVSTPSNPNTGVNTAQGGKDDAAVIKATSDGPAEKKVADTAEKGRRSTIMTTPGGLLTEENDPNLRRRRSLMGGGLIN